MIRAVVDVNVIVSALIIPRGIPYSIWSAWRSQQFTLISSEGDRHLLNLGQYEGTRIIAPREFMAILESQARLPS